MGLNFGFVKGAMMCGLFLTGVKKVDFATPALAEKQKNRIVAQEAIRTNHRHIVFTIHLEPGLILIPMPIC